MKYIMKNFNWESSEEWLTLEEFYKKYPHHKPIKYKNLDGYSMEEIIKKINSISQPNYYILKKQDKNLLIFSVEKNKYGSTIQIQYVSEANISLLPIGMNFSDKGLQEWFRNRVLPWSRAFSNELVKSINQHRMKPLEIIIMTLGLSLNDDYWIVPIDFQGKFADYNFYDNELNETLSITAIKGGRAKISMMSPLSPEFTTNGNLPKCWLRINNKVYLYKRGSGWRKFKMSNEGFEPYNEYYASELAQCMGINHVVYDLHQWQGELCSRCELFTSKDFSFVPIVKFVGSAFLYEVYSFYEHYGEKFREAFIDMLLFDYLIANKDRHYNNFGLLVSNETNEIISPAPIFDNGLSLLNNLPPESWSNFEDVLEFADITLPKTFDTYYNEEYLQFMLPLLERRHSKMLEQLIKFSFQPHPIYNFDEVRLNALSKLIQYRAKFLLEQLNNCLFS